MASALILFKTSPMFDFDCTNKGLILKQILPQREGYCRESVAAQQPVDQGRHVTDAHDTVTIHVGTID